MEASANEKLLRAAAAGDTAAWDELVAAYTNLLWSVTRGHRLRDADAADAVQMTWLRLVENLDRIRDPERLGAWLATTARRECLRTLARSRRELPTGSGDSLDRADDSLAPLDAALLADEGSAALWLCFGRLSPACQRLLRVLMADPAPSYLEVSAALDMPVGSIGPRRGRCLAALRECLAA